MIKTTTGKLVNAFKILDRVVKQYEDKKGDLPFETTYALGRMLQKLELEEINFNNELNKLIDKYGSEDDKSGIKKITDKNPNWEIFLKDLSVIENEEVELAGVFPLKYELVKRLKGISVKEALMLEGFVEEETKTYV